MTTTAPAGPNGGPVRIGLVGYAKGGRSFHAPVIAATPGCVLAGVVTRSPERRAELVADHPGVPAYDSLAAMAASGDVEAVAVSTPAATHADLALEAVALGLPVLCDKPFAVSAAQARTVLDAAAAAGVLVSAHHNRRHDADLRTVAALLASGDLGRLVRLEARIEQGTPPGGVPSSGGTLLLDLGSHLVDQALVLLGPVSSVHAVVDPPTGAEPSGRFSLLLRHRSGVVSSLVGDVLLQGPPAPRWRLLGEDGTYEAPAADVQADAVMAGHGPLDLGDRWGVVPPERWGTLHRDGTSRVRPSVRGDWRDLYTDFALAVRGEGPPPVAPDDVVAGLALLDAAAVSARSGEVVHL